MSAQVFLYFITKIRSRTFHYEPTTYFLCLCTFPIYTYSHWKKHKNACLKACASPSQAYADAQLPARKEPGKPVSGGSTSSSVPSKLVKELLLAPGSTDYNLVLSYAEDFFISHEYKAAEHYARKALRMCQNINKKNRTHPDLCKLHNLLARIHQIQGNFTDADLHLTLERDIRFQIEDVASIGMAYCTSLMAHLRVAQHRLDEALVLFEEGEDAYFSVLGASTNNFLNPVEGAMDALIRTATPKAFEQAHQKGVRALERLRGSPLEGQMEMATLMVRIGVALTKLEDLLGAEQMFHDALKILEVVAVDHPTLFAELPKCLTKIGGLYRDSFRITSPFVKEYFIKAVELCNAYPGKVSSHDLEDVRYHLRVYDTLSATPPLGIEREVKGHPALLEGYSISYTLSPNESDASASDVPILSSSSKISETDAVGEDVVDGGTSGSGGGGGDVDDDDDDDDVDDDDDDDDGDGDVSVGGDNH